MLDFSLKAKLKEAQFNNLQGLDVSIKIKKSNKENHPALKLALNNYANSIIEATHTLDSDIQFIITEEKSNSVKAVDKAIVDIVDGCTCQSCTIVNKIYNGQELTEEEKEVHPFKIMLKIVTLQHNSVITEEQADKITYKMDYIYGKPSSYLK